MSTCGVCMISSWCWYAQVVDAPVDPGPTRWRGESVDRVVRLVQCGRRSGISEGLTCALIAITEERHRRVESGIEQQNQKSERIQDGGQ